MAYDRSLTDILGPIDGTYRDWLVRSSRRYVTEDIDRKTLEWLQISSMRNKYTGYVSVNQTDIKDWVDRAYDMGAVIMALCSEVKHLENSKKILEEQLNGNEREEKEKIPEYDLPTSVSAL